MTTLAAAAATAAAPDAQNAMLATVTVAAPWQRPGLLIYVVMLPALAAAGTFIRVGVGRWCKRPRHRQ